MVSNPCPCWSNKPYPDCCEPYHEGRMPENALVLMRSRYSAYSLGLPEYIIKTTHSDHPGYSRDFDQWTKDILLFSDSTDFEGLTILEFVDGKENATVTFTAHLKQSGQDTSFTEKSYFVKVGDQWLYYAGEGGRRK